MQALVFRGVGQLPDYTTLPPPEPQGDEVRVTLRAAALNHRDVWITKGLYPGIQPDVIMGSDGAGEVNGRSVVINPNLGWGPDERFPDRRYAILGMPRHGTFAEAIVVAPDRLFDKPTHLSWAEAAALPLAGLTAYRAVFTKGQVDSGQHVLVTGIGGGVALMAAQLALAAGAIVYGTSGSDQKLAQAHKLGLAGGANYRQQDWAEQLRQQARGFDVIIDSAGGAGFTELIKLANPGARIVFYGGGQGPVPKLSLQAIFWKQLQLLGTSMGSDAEFGRMIDFVSTHQLRPVVDKVYPLSEAAAALARMDDGEQFGKIVLSMNA